MKVSVFRISALGLSLFAASHATAVPYWDNDFFFDTIAAGSSISDNFNLLNSGYDPATQQIYSAFAVFTVLDYNSQQTSVTVNLDGGAFAQSTSAYLPFFLSGGIAGQALATLDQQGIVSYTVSNVGTSSFMLISASLNAEAGARNGGYPGYVPVPDGGATLGLLGVCLLGIGVLYRFTQGKRIASRLSA